MKKATTFRYMIRKIFANAKKQFPVKASQLYDGGAVYYQNGNDSTPFDWQTNEHLCEFMVFWKKSELGYLKLTIGKDGSYDLYVYHDGAMLPYHEEHCDNFLSEDDAFELAAVMMEIADSKCNWDYPINHLDWDVDIAKCVEEHECELKPYEWGEW